MHVLAAKCRQPVKVALHLQPGVHCTAQADAGGHVRARAAPLHSTTQLRYTAQRSTAQHSTARQPTARQATHSDGTAIREQVAVTGVGV